MSKHFGFFSCCFFFSYFLNFNLLSNFPTWMCAHCRDFRCSFPVSPHTPREGGWVTCFGGLVLVYVLCAQAPSACTAPRTRGAGRREGQGEALVSSKSSCSLGTSSCGLCALVC